MSSVALYFQVHQPYRLRRYRYSHVGVDDNYFDHDLNASIIRRVAHKCYIPATKILLQAARELGSEFRVCFSFSGVLLEQLEQECPQALALFQELVATGCVELLSETYHHSLASIFNPREFLEQIDLHTDAIERYFGLTPKVFRNTELIHSDEIARELSERRFIGILAEGADDILGWRSPNFVYQVPFSETRLLLRNYRLSDEIAFRFSQRPRTAEEFVSGLVQSCEGSDSVGLFMDYETFGEHCWEGSGIFTFLRALPREIISRSDWNLLTPSQIFESCRSEGDLSFPRVTSWADSERDLSAWFGNKIQHSALTQIYDQNLGFTGDIWRRLQTSDHFYYMSTKRLADGGVHQYFNPFESPYDAFIAYMNVLRDFRNRAQSSLTTVPISVIKSTFLELEQQRVDVHQN